jgi:hypothetical protein
MKQPSSERDGVVRTTHKGRRDGSRGNTEPLSFTMNVAVMWIATIIQSSFSHLSVEIGKF